MKKVEEITMEDFIKAKLILAFLRESETQKLLRYVKTINEIDSVTKLLDKHIEENE